MSGKRAFGRSMRSVAEKIRPSRWDHAIDLEGNFPYSQILVEVDWAVHDAHFIMLVGLHFELFGRRDNTIIWRWRR